MKKVFYIPMNDAELIKSAESICKNFGHQGFSSPGGVLVTKGYNPAVLKDLENDTELYVGVHGNESRMIVSNGLDLKDPKRKEMSPTVLANQIWHEGLSIDHRTLKLWVCYSGLEPPGFGRAFATELGKLGYTRCSVYGYKEAVWGSKAVALEENAGHKTTMSGARASEVRVKVSA